MQLQAQRTRYVEQRAMQKSGARLYALGHYAELRGQRMTLLVCMRLERTCLRRLEPVSDKRCQERWPLAPGGPTCLCMLRMIDTADLPKKFGLWSQYQISHTGKSGLLVPGGRGDCAQHA